MNNFINCQNFLYKYLVLELYEKLYRLKKYIVTCRKFDKKNNDENILDLFLESIKIIGNEVEDLRSTIINEISDLQKLPISIKISQHSKSIARIHEELKNLHSSWTLPEIKTFTTDVTRSGNYKPQDIYIILSDNYSFLERNLGKKFESTLREAYGHLDIGELKETHSFVIPKIEFSNPLNWTIIAHESGHLQRDNINKIIDDPNIMPDDISSLNKAIIKNWAEEIYCDIYAISVLGPAYFISFVSFALLSPLDYGLLSFSKLHPSVILRATIMINYLKDNKLSFKAEWGVEDYSKLFYDSLIQQSEIFKDGPKDTIEGLTKFNRNLRKLIKDLKLNEFSIKEIDCKRLIDLLSNLKEGIPIGSVCLPIEFDKEELLKKDHLSSAELNKLKEAVTERSTKVWEILNTGWLYKLEHGFISGENIFFKDTVDTDVMVKIDSYGKVIDFLDDRLLASISSAQIINIIENG